MREPFAEPAKEMSHFVNDLIEGICATPVRWLVEIDEAIARGNKVELNLTVKFSLSNPEAFRTAIQTAVIEYDKRRQLGIL